ncbi:tellurite resistance TerB family protein [Nodosilinea sp. LEGE 07088]|uniref:tellurite resistance TerB family protein n=1 Tax=Nodosilinea sp. LEGE 07088 TaxID=2777968 RepID=UPI00187F7010|nr:tellurite resistance TerB family protein [Nodosilinea sp. LEGE 07088]MBE9137687.1 tellurite resistance TerB family protein [Nodosilinea sp. LEGE 07088]
MTELSMGSAEALASIAMVAIAADGYLAEQEGQDMTMLLSRMVMFNSYSAEAMQHMFDLVLERLKQQGPGVLVNEAKGALSQDMRETAFAIATDLVLSDRTVTPQEQAFLEDLYRILDIPSDLAQRIVQVMTIKNRG